MGGESSFTLLGPQLVGGVDTVQREGECQDGNGEKGGMDRVDAGHLGGESYILLPF